MIIRTVHVVATEAGWPAIVTAAATAVLAALAFAQIRAGKAQTAECLRR